MRRGVPWFHGEGGGIAIILLIILMVLAFPVSIAAVSIAGQLSHNAPVYDNLLVQPYSAGGGVEHAAWEIRQDPNFNEGLIPSSPSRQRTIISNGQDVLVTTTRVFTLPPLRGQGLVVARKTVTPDTAPADIAREFTYTIAIKNEGSDTVTLEQVVDFLPPGFSYLGSTEGITAADPTITSTPGSAVTTSVLYLNHAGALP